MSRSASVGSIILTVLISIGSILLTGGTVCADTCVAPPAGLVAWWTADGNANDLISGYNGTMMNHTTFAEGMIGKAFSFDGSDDYVSIPVAAGISGNGPGTIELWFKAKAVPSPGNYGYLFIQSNSSTGADLRIYLYGNNTLNFVGHNGATYEFNVSTPFADTSSWHHVVGTWSAADTRFYLDNVLIGSDSSINMGAFVPDALSIGADLYPNHYFNGLIDEVRLYNRTLAAPEIGQIFNAGSAGICKPCTAAPDGLLAWWAGEDNAQDMLGGNAGVLMNGTSFAEGRAGRAFSFDGVDDYVEIPHSSSLNFGANQPMTVSLWAKRTSASNINTLFAKRPDCGAQVHYLLQWYEPGDWFHFGSSGGGVHTTADKLPLNTWTFVTVSFDGTIATMYINGSPVASNPMSFYPNTEPLTLGAEPSCPDYFNGLIDELAFFSRALTAEEIAALYNAGSGGVCKPCTARPSGMVGWWKGDGNASDEFGNNNGLAQNGAAYAPGRVGQAFSFSNQGEVTVPYSPVLDLDSIPSSTIEGWFSSSTSGLATGMIASTYACGSPNGWFASADQGCYLGGAHIGGWGFQGVNVNDGKLHHFACVKDGTIGREYVDGVLRAEATVSDFLPSANRGMMLGAETSCFQGLRLNGVVDELKIYHRALDTAEIAAIFNSCPAGACDAMPFPFSFSDVTGASTNAARQSNEITVSGINAPVSVSVSSGSYRLNGGGCGLTSGTAVNGDKIVVCLTASSSYSATVSTTLTVGTKSALFKVITRDPVLTVVGGVDTTIAGTLTSISGLNCNIAVGGGTSDTCQVSVPVGPQQLAEGSDSIYAASTDCMFDPADFCTVQVTADTTVTVTLKEYETRRLFGTTPVKYFKTLISALSAAYADGDILELRELTFTEAGPPEYMRPAAISLRGGLQTGFIPGASKYTTVSPGLSFSGGPVTIENIIVQ